MFAFHFQAIGLFADESGCQGQNAMLDSHEKASDYDNTLSSVRRIDWQIKKEVVKTRTPRISRGL